MCPCVARSEPSARGGAAHTSDRKAARGAASAVEPAAWQRWASGTAVTADRVLRTFGSSKRQYLQSGAREREPFQDNCRF